VFNKIFSEEMDGFRTGNFNATALASKLKVSANHK